jgi:hypothetical protein
MRIVRHTVAMKTRQCVETLCVVMLFFAVCGLAQAQDVAQSAVPMGSVNGTIVASDTQRPVRFASVTLTPVSPPKPKLPSEDEKKKNGDDMASAMKALGSLMSSVTMLTAQTGLDGTFTVEGVAPGDYYISATAPGYISPVAVAMEKASPGAKGKALLAGVPTVHVEAGRTARGDETLERGAAVSGTVVYDDGSPAAGVAVAVKAVDEDDKKAEKKAKKKDDDDLDDDTMAMMPLVMSAAMSERVTGMTDDRGRFRLAGIAPGNYRLQATVGAVKTISMRAGVMDVAAMSRATPLLIYAPATLHTKDATTLTLKPGDERADIEIRADLAGLHTVSGRVASAVDHHALNAGTVVLVDSADKNFKRTTGIDKDGNFKVTYVPSGTYTLTVSDGADTEPSKKKPGAAFGGMMRFASTTTLKSYEDASQPLIVAASDVAGLSVECKESAKVKKDVDLNQLFGGADKDE